MESTTDTTRRDYLRTHPRTPQEDAELVMLEQGSHTPSQANAPMLRPAGGDETAARAAEVAARAKTEAADAAAAAERDAARQVAASDAERLAYLRSAYPRTPEQAAELEAMETRIAADKETEQKARLTGPMRLWLVHAMDGNAPPFHFANVAQSLVVAARTPGHARDIAAAEVGAYPDVWHDDMATACVPLMPREPGVVASETTLRRIMMENETEDRIDAAAAQREAAATAATQAEIARVDALRQKPGTE